MDAHCYSSKLLLKNVYDFYDSDLGFDLNLKCPVVTLKVFWTEWAVVIFVVRYYDYIIQTGRRPSSLYLLSIISAGTRLCFSPTRLSRNKCSGACLLRGKISFVPGAN